MNLDHIGIAVKNLDTAAKFYASLGIKPSAREVIADQGVEVLVLPVGQPRLELLQPVSEDSPVARFIERKGEGLHHIAIRVADIRATLAQLKQEGVELIDQEPRTGAENSLIAFVHPRATHGVLLELTQPG